jgi:hypothetical protein
MVVRRLRLILSRPAEMRRDRDVAAVILLVRPGSPLARRVTCTYFRASGGAVLVLTYTASEAV